MIFVKFGSIWYKKNCTVEEISRRSSQSYPQINHMISICGAVNVFWKSPYTSIFSWVRVRVHMSLPFFRVVWSTLRHFCTLRACDGEESWANGVKFCQWLINTIDHIFLLRRVWQFGNHCLKAEQKNMIFVKFRSIWYKKNCTVEEILRRSSQSYPQINHMINICGAVNVFFENPHIPPYFLGSGSICCCHFSRHCYFNPPLLKPLWTMPRWCVETIPHWNRLSAVTYFLSPPAPP